MKKCTRVGRVILAVAGLYTLERMLDHDISELSKPELPSAAPVKRLIFKWDKDTGNWVCKTYNDPVKPQSRHWYKHGDY